MTIPTPPLDFNSLPMYIGQPGEMNQLRMPDSPYQRVSTRGENVQTLASGGIVVTRRPKTKTVWTLPFSGMYADTASILVAYYRGTMGPGPYVFIDPATRNFLGGDVSAMGSIISAISGWATSVTATSSLSFDLSALNAPFVGSGVMDWTGATNTNKTGLGSWIGGVLMPDLLSAPVYLSAQPAYSSIYARTATSTASVSYSIAGVNAAGASQIAGSTQTATLNNTTWTKLTSVLAAGNANALYILPTILCNTSSAPVLQFACADLQYGVNALSAGAWVVGEGCPRVNLAPLSSGAGFTQVLRLLPYRDITGLMLAEI